MSRVDKNTMIDDTSTAKINTPNLQNANRGNARDKRSPRKKLSTQFSNTN